MGLLSDSQIRSLCVDQNGDPIEKAMIKPFAEGEKRPGRISWGLSSAGHDIRLGRRFKVFDPATIYGDALLLNIRGQLSVIDPKTDSWHYLFKDIEADSCVIPPNSFALAESLEEFDMPKDVLATCLGKSSYARCGIIINVTPLEPGWKGRLTMEISNSTPLPARVHALEGIAQLLFFRTDKWPDKTYADKSAGGAGKYQGQTGLTLPKVDGQERSE
jgi:dCTP deaminase